MLLLFKLVFQKGGIENKLLIYLFFPLKIFQLEQKKKIFPYYLLIFFIPVLYKGVLV